MEYLTSKQVSEKWGIGQCRIIRLAREGRIEGAKQFGKNWMIPENAQKPTDGRTRTAKETPKTDYFRFPLYVNCEENEFMPPLSAEEIILRKAEIDYYSCRFDRAQAAFDKLSKSTENIYIRIISLFFLCSLSVEIFCGENFFNHVGRLRTELSKDFPHKKDMEIVIPWLNTVMAQLKSVSDNLNVDPLYEYSPTVWPLISYLSFYHITTATPNPKAAVHLDVYEILCRKLTRDGHYYEACELHFLLFFADYIMMNEEPMLYHLREGLSLVKKHGLFVIAASYEYYYRNAFDAVFGEFPENFVKTIRYYSEIFRDSLGKFSQKYHITEIYKNLSNGDYPYLIYATQKMSNKQVAHIMHISERTVAKRYNAIYDKMGVFSKQELLKLVNISYDLKKQ